MVVVTFESSLRAVLARPLPGVDAQLRMAPTPRVGWDPAVMPGDLRDAAGLVLLYPIDDVWLMPLTVRAASLRSHTGQVSLPGGRVDEEESIEGAALREAHEEIGIVPSSVRVAGRLTPLHIPVSGHILHPVVGVVDGRPEFRPAEQEVARVIEVPIASLIDDAIVRHERQTRRRDGRTFDVRVPYFDVDGERVWGATAMVLAELAEIVRRAPPLTYGGPRL
jgi:8-oxo-dGTP pyrophosphatase MutT (NUDIX family)